MSQKPTRRQDRPRATESESDCQRSFAGFGWVMRDRSSKAGGPSPEEMINDLPTKSEKIRVLFQTGMSKADIGRYLGISYQHVYNVLARGDGTRARARAEGLELPLRVRVQDDGSIHLPPPIGRALSIEPGSDLFVRADGRALLVMTRTDAITWVKSVVSNGGADADELVKAFLSQL